MSEAKRECQVTVIPTGRFGAFHAHPCRRPAKGLIGELHACGIHIGADKRSKAITAQYRSDEQAAYEKQERDKETIAELWPQLFVFERALKSCPCGFTSRPMPCCAEYALKSLAEAKAHVDSLKTSK